MTYGCVRRRSLTLPSDCRQPRPVTARLMRTDRPDRRRTSSIDAPVNAGLPRPGARSRSVARHSGLRLSTAVGVRHRCQLWYGVEL